jgi:hypothetical protein
MTVIASPEGSVVNGALRRTVTTLSTAEWVDMAPDCLANEIEVRTVLYSAESGTGLVAEPQRAIPFSIVVVE